MYLGSFLLKLQRGKQSAQAVQGLYEMSLGTSEGILNKADCQVQLSFQLPHGSVYSFLLQEVSLNFSEQKQKVLGKLRSD